MTANIKESMEGQIETLKNHVAQELGTLTEFVEIQLEGLEKAHSNSKETFAVQKEAMEEQLETLKEYREEKLEGLQEMQEAQSASTEKIKSLTENLEEMIQTSLDDTKETFAMQIDKFQGVSKVLMKEQIMSLRQRKSCIQDRQHYGRFLKQNKKDCQRRFKPVSTNHTLITLR